MLNFIARRLASAIVIMLIVSIAMYLLLDLAMDPIEDLRTSTSPNKQQLIESRIRMLNLDTPSIVRYFWWLRDASGCFIGQCDLGTAWRSNQLVTDLLGGAIITTLQLIVAATVVSIALGVTVGLVSALRQYTGFDYTITFISFVLYSLPIFWVAVLLKQFLAIGFNDFVNNPAISWPAVIILSIVSGLFWMGAIGGQKTRRAMVFGVAAVVTLGALVYVLTSGWLLNPSLGIVVVLVTSVGIAVVVTMLSTGLRNKRALYSALTTAGIGIVLYYPMQWFFYYVTANFWVIVGLAVVSIGVGILVGYLFGGPDRSQSSRTAAIVAFLVGGLIFVDKVMQSWDLYSNANVIKNRPIATIGSATPGLGGDFWVSTLDTFTHLLLPSIALILISFATYTRYSRGSMLEVLNQDYIRTARAKGLTERTVIMRHALRNALLPLASIVPVDIITLIGGAVITETIFGWSGMGKLFIDSLRDSEIDPVMAYIMITGFLAIFANLVADFVYAILDPRIRVNA
ncbi:ABC transporter permease [Saxibacter everestensis]|uniref:ABC transporter permease n=1 Tax=Saxibacter everestensis TaxID=2909229 RepID=A0ABY8QNN3_9MICO|nr:ABC transporter permease [Brevibacteriaceae bacterium ZFBP1038]